MVQLGANRYGKAEVHLVHVARGGAADGGDLVTDRTVSTSLSGDLEATHVSGDNTNVLTTDTQKNVDFAFAKQLGPVAAETYALALADHFVGSQQPITRARVEVRETSWTRIADQQNSFSRAGGFTRQTVVIHDQARGTSVVSGIADLIVMNTRNSEFWGFPKEKYTTLGETNDRMLATEVSANWRYRNVDIDWTATFETVRETLLRVFAETYSYSLQQTLYAIGTKIIETVPSICEVRLVLPNKHHFLVDLEPFGLRNDNEVYYAPDRPYGLIEGTVLADNPGDPGLAWD